MFSLFCRAAVAIRRTSLPIVDLIEADPGGFTFDPYHATHQGSGIRIWIANDAYGLDYQVWRGTDEELKSATQSQLRCSGNWSSDIKVGFFEKCLIWSAIGALVKRQKSAVQRKAEADLQARIDRALVARSAA